MGLILILLACLIIKPSDSFGKINCRGSLQPKLDNGEIAAEKIVVIPLDFDNVYVSNTNDGRFVFSSDRKSDEWTFLKAYDHSELLQARGYKDLNPKFDYSNIRFDRPTLIRFRDQAVVIFNLVCKI